MNLLVTALVVVIVAIASGARGADPTLDTHSITIPKGDIAYWLVHDSSTTQIVGDASAPNKHRVIRWGPGGIYEGRRTYAILAFRLVSGAPGRMYDWHTQPDDVGGWMPPCSHGVAPLAIDYWGDSRGLELSVEPEDSGCSGGSGNYHFQIFSQSDTEARRGRWVVLWAEITWGRRDLSTTGAVKVWVVGENSPRVDVSGINTHWPSQNQVSFWEGSYWITGSPGQTVEIAATRFGRTPKEAYEDVPALYSAAPAETQGGTSTQVSSPASSESAVPAALQWSPAPSPAPVPAPVPPAPSPAPVPAPLPPAPKLIVKKVVAGAATSPSAFSFSVSNGGGTHAFEGDGQNELTLPVGTYTVTEPATSGWTTTYAGCSNLVLSSPQSTVPTCTVTNTKQSATPPSPPTHEPPPAPQPTPAPPKLIVKKVVVGAATSPSAFRFSVSNGGGTHSFEADGQNELALPAGKYTVTEPGTKGWTTTYSDCSDVVVPSRQAAVPTCIVTNTKRQPVDPLDSSPPAQPGNLSVEATTPTSVTLSWSASEDDMRVAGYDVYADRDRVASGKRLTVTVSDLACGTAYRFAVEAYDDAGNRSAPGSATASTNPCPVAPTVDPVKPHLPKKADPHVAQSEQAGSKGTPASPPATPAPAGVTPNPSVDSPAGSPRCDANAARAGLERAKSSYGLIRMLRLLRVVTYGFLGPPAPNVSRPQGIEEKDECANDLAWVDWDGRRFFTRGALKIHLEWSGRHWRTWVTQHPQAYGRLPA